jgi:hypothetical protein
VTSSCTFGIWRIMVMRGRVAKPEPCPLLPRRGSVRGVMLARRVEHARVRAR